MVIFHSYVSLPEGTSFFAIEPLILDMEMGLSCNLKELGRVIHSEFPKRIEQ